MRIERARQHVAALSRPLTHVTDQELVTATLNVDDAAVGCVKPGQFAVVSSLVESYDPTAHDVSASVPKPALITLPVWSPSKVRSAVVIWVPSALSV